MCSTAVPQWNKRLHGGACARTAFMVALACVLWLCAIPLSRPAAAPKARGAWKAKLIFDRGVYQMSTGNYAAAIVSLKRAYRLRPRSRVLFLIGQCYELDDQLSRALTIYQQLLGGRKRARNRTIILRRIKLVQQQIAQRAPGTPGQAEGATPEAAQTAAPPTAEKPTAQAPPHRPAEEDPSVEQAPSTQPAIEAASTDIEVVEDVEDEDDWTIQESAVVDAGSAATVEPQVLWGATALLQTAIDTTFDGDDRSVYENVLEVYGRASGSLQYQPKSWIKLKLSGELLLRVTNARAPGEQGYLGHTNRNDVEPQLQDSYIVFSASWLDVSAGMMTTVWGVNDLVNPNDLLTAKDLRNGPSFNIESLRVASPTIKTDVYYKNLTFSAIWMPGFVPHKIDLFGSDYAIFGPGSPGLLGKSGAILSALVDSSIASQIQSPLLQTTMPRFIKGSILGGRLALSARGWDFAVQYLYTLTRTSVIRLHQNLVAAVQPLINKPLSHFSDEDWQTVGQLLSFDNSRLFEATYHRYHQAGLSISTSFWKLALSLDTSYSYQLPIWLGGEVPIIGEGPLYSTSILSQVSATTLGLRYTYGQIVLITFEGWYELLIDVARQATDRRPTLLLGGPHRTGLATLLRLTWERFHLTFNLFGSSELPHLGYLIIPQMSYRAGDHLGFFVGARIYGGRPGSTGALYDPNDEILLGVQGYL